MKTRACGLALLLLGAMWLSGCQAAKPDPTLKNLSVMELESRQARELSDLKSAALAEAGPLITEMEASLRTAPLDVPPNLDKYQRGMAALRKKYEKRATAIEARYEPYLKAAKSPQGGK